MVAIIEALVKGYKYLNEDLADPRVNDWFLVGSLWPCLAILGLYIYFVLNLGPRLMADKEPFKIERIIQVYNIFQIVACAYVLYKMLTLAWLDGYSLVCEPVDYSNTPKAIEIAGLVWMYFMLKVLDLFDTVFFVLRKKYNQISFLHVPSQCYDWSVLDVHEVLPWWTQHIFTINVFVHIIMYSHYFITSFKIRNVWWKKYITQLQITQFIIVLLHFSQLLWVDDCGYPLWPVFLFIPLNLLMTILFSDFYYKTYIKKKPTVTHRTVNFKEE